MPVKTVVTISLNPAIDGAASAEAIRPLRKIRTTDESYSPGGGGIVVARVLRELGQPAMVIYLAGGPTAPILDELLREAGIDGRRVPIAGTTRIGHTVFERVSGMEYRFVPEGPEVTPDEWDRALEELSRLEFDYVVASGSLPRGIPADAYGRVVDLAAEKGARVVLDTSGPALRATLDRGVFLVKPSLGELESLIGRPLVDAAGQEAVARRLIDAGNAEIVAVSLGRQGAMIVSKDGAWRHAGAPVAARSAVGAGDSFVAAVTLAIIREWPLGDVLAYGVAAGTAAVMTPGTGTCSAADVDRIFADSRGET